MSGVEAAQAMLAIQPLAIIFITGYAVEEIRQRAQGLNPLGVLIKPVGIFEIESLIESIPRD
jgi:CheY-like chemotaxis protein